VKFATANPRTQAGRLSFGGEEGRIRIRLRYPWAIAPTINTMKPVATAMATFASIDKFITSPLNYGGKPRRPRFLIFSVDRFESQRANGCQTEEVKIKKGLRELERKK